MKETNLLKRELFYEFLLFIAGIASVCLFFKNNILLMVVLIAGWIIGILVWHEKHDIIFFLVGAILGSLGELVCVNYGVWRYENPSFLGIPIWLPFVWGLSAVFIKRVSETFLKIEKK